jgi:hypothetical protein
MGETLLPEWLASFRASGPPCRVSAAITNSEQVAHAVRHGAAETASSKDRPEASGDCES